MNLHATFLQELIDQKTISVVVDSHLSHAVVQPIVTGKKMTRKLRRMPQADTTSAHEEEEDVLSLNDLKEMMPATSRWEGLSSSSSSDSSTSSTSLESSFSDSEEMQPNMRCPTIQQIRLSAFPKKAKSASKKRFLLPWQKRANASSKGDESQSHSTISDDRSTAQPISPFLKSLDRPSNPTLHKPWKERRSSDKPPKITFRRSSAEINSETA